MSKKVFSYYVAHCPYLDDEKSIMVEFAEVPLLGRSSPDYKKFSYHCDLSDECTCLDNYGACELYYHAPEPN